MRKVLISILILLLVLMTYYVIIKNITFLNWRSKSIGNIKTLNGDLTTKIKTLEQKNNSEYLQSIDTLEESIRNLKVSKEKYENKIKYVTDKVELGVIQKKEYKIERLWIALENYARKEKIELKIDIKNSTVDTNTYDLDITLSGQYIGITDFLYDIEKDDTLAFKILNFKLTPTTTSETSNKEEEKTQKTSKKAEEETSEKVYADFDKLKATFTIEDVRINFN